jgi:hypothetical protein
MNRTISISIFSSIVMGILEAFILTQEYKRPFYYTSIIVATLMAGIGTFLSRTFFKEKIPTIMFLIIVLFELPLSLYGYPLEPEANLFERLIIAGSFGAVSYIIGHQLFLLFLN